jgi:hypothetical protein
MRSLFIYAAIATVIVACSSIGTNESLITEPSKGELSNKQAELAKKIIFWEEPDLVVQKNPDYVDAKKSILEFWQSYAARDWERCWELETPGVKAAMKKDFYLAIWGNSPRLKKLTLSEMEFVQPGQAKVKVVFEVVLPKNAPQFSADKVELSYRWMKFDNEKLWLRDYRDPIFRP